MRRNGPGVDDGRRRLGQIRRSRWSGRLCLDLLRGFVLPKALEGGLAKLPVCRETLVLDLSDKVWPEPVDLA